MALKFWEEETPECVETSWLKLQFYHGHGKLAITRKFQRDGVAKLRTVNLDIRDIRNTPEVAELLEKVINEWKGER